MQSTARRIPMPSFVGNPFSKVEGDDSPSPRPLSRRLCGIAVPGDCCKAACRDRWRRGFVPGPVCVPQTRTPGAEGEFDWGKFQAIMPFQDPFAHHFKTLLGPLSRKAMYPLTNGFRDIHGFEQFTFGFSPHHQNTRRPYGAHPSEALRHC
jgi:hypothetical protein